MSVASYPMFKLKPRTIFYLSVFFFLFNVFFKYIFMSMQMRSFVYSSLGQRAISQLCLVPCLVVQDFRQLKYRLFCSSNHFSFLLFLTNSFYVFFNIPKYENQIFRIHLIMGSHTCISTIIWYEFV